jgi:hypothetical protein
MNILSGIGVKHNEIGFQRPIQLTCPYCHKTGTSLMNIYTDSNKRMFQQFLCHRYLGGCGATKTIEYPRSMVKPTLPESLADARDEREEFDRQPMRNRSPVRGRKIDAGLCEWWRQNKKKRKKPWFTRDVI